MIKAKLSQPNPRIARHPAIPILMMLLVGLLCNTVHATQYYYDELGRLISVVDSNGQSTVYQYDPSGNLLGVDIVNQTVLDIIDFTPKSGPVGTSVDIIGSGFSSDPVANTVLINGTVANISSAFANVLTVSIPAGASTGLIQVDTSAGSALSTDLLVVEADSGAPIITSLSSNCLSGGQTFTITGLNLGEQSLTQVTVGDILASATVDSPEQITVTAPAGSLGGQVTVSTDLGSTDSDEAIAILNPASACNSFDSARWIEADTLVVHPGVPSSKKAYWFFRAEQDQWLNLQASGPNADARTLRVPLKLHQPGGTQVFNSTLFSSRYTAEFNRTTGPGVYRIELSAGQAFDGVLETPIDIALDGPAVTVTTARAQSKRIIVPQGTGQGFSLGAESLSITGGSSAAISMRDAANTLITPLPSSDTNCSATAATTACGAAYAAIDTGDAWILTWAPVASASNSSAQLLLTSTSTLPLLVADSTDVVIQRQGQTQHYTFNAQSGDGYSVLLSDLDIPGTEKRATLHLIAPNGETVEPVGNAFFTTISEPGGNLTYQGLPMSGEYTLRLVPFAGHLITGNLRVEDGELLNDEPPITITRDVPGSHARFNIDAIAGESFGLGLINRDIQAPSSSQRTVTIKLYGPEGIAIPQTRSSTTQVNCGTTGTPGCDVEWIPLPFTGRYALVIEPHNNVTSYSFDIQATLSLEADIETAATTHSLTANGQDARFNFMAEAGVGKRITLNQVLPTPGGKQRTGFVLMPDGSVLTAPLLVTTLRNINSGQTVSIGDFPIDGEYTLYVDPDHASIADFTLFQTDGVVDPNLNNTLQPVIPGPWKTTPFEGLIGEQWSFTLHNADLTPPFRGTRRVRLVVYDPDNFRLIQSDSTTTEASCTQSSGSWDCDFDIPPLTKDGTYQAVAYLPIDDGTDIVTADAIAVKHNVVQGTSDSFFLTQGQNGYLAFPVTAGETLQILVTRDAVNDAGVPLAVRVYNPNGERIYQSSMTATTQVKGFTVSSTAVSGTYQIEIDPERGRTAAINVSVE